MVRIVVEVDGKIHGVNIDEKGEYRRINTSIDEISSKKEVMMDTSRSVAKSTGYKNKKSSLVVDCHEYGRNKYDDRLRKKV